MTETKNDALEFLKEQNVYRTLRNTKDNWSEDNILPVQNRTLTVKELQSIPVSDIFNVGFGNWDETVILIPLWALNLIANGEYLTTISYEKVVKTSDNIDIDTRGGFLAYGFVRIEQ